jgi:hypothetical protein
MVGRSVIGEEGERVCALENGEERETMCALGIGDEVKRWIGEEVSVQVDC